MSSGRRSPPTNTVAATYAATSSIVPTNHTMAFADIQPAQYRYAARTCTANSAGSGQMAATCSHSTTRRGLPVRPIPIPPEPVHGADHDAGERAREQRREIEAHERGVDVDTETKAGVGEQRQHAGDADDDVGQTPPAQAGDPGDEPFPDGHADDEHGDAERQQQVAAPLLPEPVEPQTLQNAGAEPVRHRDAGVPAARRRSPRPPRWRATPAVSERVAPGLGPARTIVR